MRFIGMYEALAISRSFNIRSTWKIRRASQFPEGAFLPELLWSTWTHLSLEVYLQITEVYVDELVNVEQQSVLILDEVEYFFIPIIQGGKSFKSL